MFRILLLLLLPLSLTVGLNGCETAADEGSEPTEGIITTVEEVSPGDYKIASEEIVPVPSDSRIVVNNMDGSSETYTLEEAKLIDRQMQSDSTGNARAYSPFRSAMMGYFGFMMLNRIGNRPSASAYTNNRAYQQTTNTTGSRLNSTSRARSGFGGGRSTRSFGG